MTERSRIFAGASATVALVRTSDRKEGIRRVIDLLCINPVRGKDVLLKPNFNTADPYPGSTHNNTLENLILRLKVMDARTITVGERSGPPDTVQVLVDKGARDLCRKHDVDIMNFEDLPDVGWVRFKPKPCSWKNGFEVAKPVMESDCIVTTCCLKTHAYGGIFTMSLKLSVGVTRKRNMAELHSSSRSMGKRIAEINAAFHPALILLDGIEVFIDGGPAYGTRRRADVLIAGTDRIAIDAVGLAVLKLLGSNRDIMDRKIFDQEQIQRAVELGIGVDRPDKIAITTDDGAGLEFAERLKRILLQG